MYNRVKLHRSLWIARPGKVEISSVAESGDIGAEVDQADEGDGGEDPGGDVCSGAGGGPGDYPEYVEVHCEDDGEGREES